MLVPLFSVQFPTGTGPPQSLNAGQRGCCLSAPQPGASMTNSPQRATRLAPTPRPAKLALASEVIAIFSMVFVSELIKRRAPR